jgi:SAM-dependent methyltransferase
MYIRRFISIIMHPNGKIHFLSKLSDNASILDVGCGNNSPYMVKSILPSSIYTGIDIGDYNQTKPNRADHYIVSSPESFADRIAEFDACFDAVVSSHNLEHCNDRLATFTSMMRATRPDGLMYVSFPSAGSVRFPRRIGTLNYFDDPTHKDLPPDVDQLLEMARAYGFEAVFVTRRNRPLLSWFVGLILEPISMLMNRVVRGTWELYGFEAIMILKRLRTHSKQLGVD